MTGNDDPRYPVPFATTSLPGSDFAIFSRPPPHSYPLSSIGRAILPHPLCRRRASFFPIAELTICPRHRLDARFRAQLPTPSFSDTTCFFSFLSSFLFETRRGSSWASFGHVRFSRKITSYIYVYIASSFFFRSRDAREMRYNLSWIDICTFFLIERCVPPFVCLWYKENLWYTWRKRCLSLKEWKINTLLLSINCKFLKLIILIIIR